MSIIPGYRDLKQLYESHKTLVYRGYREQDAQAVVLKILKKSYPSPKDLARYQHEYQVIRRLNSPGIIKAYSLERYQNTIFLVLEDFGGDSLKTLLERQSLTVEAFLDIAIGIVQSLNTIHAAHIIHKDINPANIIVNLATQQVKIIDFGIATALPIEHPTAKAAPKLEGTLSYLSPEQTGRMNRAMDYRSDYYSLGATFYEMLTQCQPFSTLDPLELIHSHLAKPVNPPHLISPNIPAVLSQLTLKLLAKNAEDRYQSVWGIQADLEACRYQWQVNQSIPLFTLAAEDHSAQLQLSQQLYGREAELETLKAVFQRLMTPPPPEIPKLGPEVVLISGDSGMGKTLLAHSFSPLLSEYRGYLITGKFAQTHPSTPYSAIVLALQNLVELLLGESNEQLSQWREQLLNGLGANASLLVEMVPDMALILGLQPVLPELEAQAAQHRLYRTLQQLVGIFAQPEHPLVLFVDDLQWADAESLALMTALIGCNESAYMLFIGAYRNEESQNCQAFIEELRTDQSGLAHPLQLTEISLVALSSTAVTAFIADTLRCEPASITALSEVVLAKTKGNPFFIAEFLRAIYRDQSLYFDGVQKQWCWHLDQLWQQTITDNVVDLLVDRLSKLSKTTQTLLKWAACQGHRFDLETLALVSEQSQSEINQGLQTALLEGLVYQISTNQHIEYQFTHDRVQQAIYRLIPDLEKTHVHWQIGLRLLSALAIERISFETLSVPWIYSDQLVQISVQQVFTVVNQLNLGTPPVPLDLDNSST